VDVNVVYLVGQKRLKAPNTGGIPLRPIIENEPERSASVFRKYVFGEYCRTRVSEIVAGTAGERGGGEAELEVSVSAIRLQRVPPRAGTVSQVANGLCPERLVYYS